MEKTGTTAKPRLRTVDRNQFVLRPMDVDQLIVEDHPARALWEFVGRLDLAKFYEPMKAVEGHAGQPGNDPHLLMALWLFAYSRGIGSAREIERQCDYEPGFQWLCALQPVNHHSLSDFRVKYDEALTGVFTEVLAVLNAEGLITLERVMHDGTRIRASASGNTFRSKNTLQQHLEEARLQVQAMGDPRQAAPPRKAAAQQRAKREREQKLVAAMEQLEQVRRERTAANREEARASETDPEARIMKRSGGGFEPSYNVQISTDAAAGIVVGVHVTQSGGDSPHLIPAVELMEANLNRIPGQIVADAGYIGSANIVALHGKTDLIGPLQVENPARLIAQRKRHGVKEDFASHRFVFLPERNGYLCPEQKFLPYYRKENLPQGTLYDYKAKNGTCDSCVSKPHCCPQTESRMIRRVMERPEISEFRSKMAQPENREIYKQRSQVAEFVHAWIKEKLRLRQFHVRGLKKVRCESLWAVMTYNIQQWIRLRWRKPVLA